MTTPLPADAAAILTTWFGNPAAEAPGDPALRRRWFVPDAAFDRELTERFGALVEAAAGGGLAAWEAHPLGSLAVVLLLDQFTRNVYRGSGRSFAADATAREVADRALARRDDRAVPWVARAFFYLPFEHAEDLALQARSVELFRALVAVAPPEEAAGAGALVDYAVKHHDVIARFGRFPHRNALLDRENTAEETEFLKSGRGF